MRKAKESLKNKIIGDYIIIYDSDTNRWFVNIPAPGCNTSGFALGIARGGIPNNLLARWSFILNMEDKL